MRIIWEEPEAFPHAPPGSYVSDEGWLIVGGQAWTREEWATRASKHYRRRPRREVAA
jgi:hypothetical protein